MGTVSGRARGRGAWLALGLAILVPELALAWVIAEADPGWVRLALLLLALPLLVLLGVQLRLRALDLAVFFLPMSGVALNVGFGLELSVLFCISLLVARLWRGTPLPSEPLLVYRIHIAVGCFILVLFLSIPMSLTVPVETLLGQYPWLKSVKQFGAHVGMLFVYLALLLTVRAPADLRRCYDLLLTPSLITAWYGLYQFISIYFQLHLPWEVLPFGNVGQAGRHEIGWFTRDIPRISSVAGEGPHFAMFLLIPISYLLALLVSRAEPERWPTRRILVYLLPMLAAFTLTFSRAPTLGLIVAATFILVWVRGWPVVRLSAIALALMALLVYLVPDIAVQESRTPGVFIQSEFSNRERLTTYYIGFSVFREYPVLGVGIGNFGFFYPGHRPDWAPPTGEGVRKWPVVHSVFLRYLVEAGMIGFAVFLALIGMLLRAGYASLALCAGDRRDFACAVAVFAGFLGLLVCLSFIEVMTWAFIWFQVAMVVLTHHFASRRGPAAT